MGMLRQNWSCLQLVRLDHLFSATTGHPDHLWLPQLVPPSLEGPGLGLGLRLGLEARVILISTYASRIDK